MTDTRDLIAELRRHDAAATPGPFTTTPYADSVELWNWEYDPQWPVATFDHLSKNRSANLAAFEWLRNNDRRCAGARGQGRGRTRRAEAMGQC